MLFYMHICAYTYAHIKSPGISTLDQSAMHAGTCAFHICTATHQARAQDEFTVGTYKYTSMHTFKARTRTHTHARTNEEVQALRTAGVHRSQVQRRHVVLVRIACIDGHLLAVR
jgi:hypothetical protein